MAAVAAVSRQIQLSRKRKRNVFRKTRRLCRPRNCVMYNNNAYTVQGDQNVVLQSYRNII